VAGGKPYQSCLIPYVDEIIALRRRKPPMPFSQIAELLRKKYQIAISRTSICNFIRVRAKKSYKTKTCKYAWDIEINSPNISSQSTKEAPFTQKPTALHKPDNKQTPVSDMPKPQVKVEDKPPVSDAPKPDDEYKPEPFEYVYSPYYNLHRLPPEEVAIRRKRIEERKKQQ